MDSALKRAIFSAARDPKLASAIFGAAQRSRQARAPSPPELPLLALAAAPPPPPPGPQAQAIAYDLSVHLSFLGAHQEDRARNLLSPATWRVVQRLGGWRVLHDLPRAVRQDGLAPRVAKVLDGKDRPREEGQAADIACPLSFPAAQRLVARWRQLVSSLDDRCALEAVRMGLTQGSFSLLLDRVAAAVEEGSLPLDRAQAALLRLICRCPGRSQG